jgi:hypothetical protein
LKEKEVLFDLIGCLAGSGRLFVLLLMEYFSFKKFMDGREKFVWHVAGNRQDLFGWPNTYVIRVYIKLHILQTPTGARLGRIILQVCNLRSVKLIRRAYLFS